MKKIIAIILTMCVLVLPITLSAHWATQSIEYVIQNEFITSDSVLLTQLDTPILRSAVVELVSNAMPEQLDVADIVLGDGYGDLMLERTITREELFTVIGRAFSLSSEDFTVLNVFADVADISGYAKPFISGLVQESLVFGYPTGEIMPQGDITIAEVIAILERVHRYAEENSTMDESTAPEENQPETPTNPPIISNGGGSRPRPPVTPPTIDTAPPEIIFTLSDENPTWESVTVTVDVTDNVGVRNVRWVRALSAGGCGAYGIAGLAHIPYDVNYRKVIMYLLLGDWDDPHVEEYIENLREQTCVQTIENYFSNALRLLDHNLSYEDWKNSPEEFFETLFEDISNPLVRNEITTKQNGMFFIFAEDMQGNITIQEISVDNIKLAQADLDITKYENPVDDVVAVVNIVDIEENPNAPVVERWLIPGRIAMVGGGFLDPNLALARFVETAQNNGTVVAETNGEFSITELDVENASRWGGAFMFVMLDAWDNYSFTTIVISN